MKITERLIGMLLCGLAALCLLSCSTSRESLDPAPAAANAQKETVYMHDTTFVEGSTRTIVEHDTIAGKPRVITTTITKTKTVKLAGQTKIVRDTVFLRSQPVKAQKATTVKAHNKKAVRWLIYALIIILFILSILSCIVPCDKLIKGIRNVVLSIKVLVKKAAKRAAHFFNRLKIAL